MSQSSRNLSQSVLVPQEDGDQTTRDLLSHLVQRHLVPGAGGALDGQRVAVVLVVLQQRPDDEDVGGEPDRTPPVRVAAERAR